MENRQPGTPTHTPGTPRRNPETPQNNLNVEVVTDTWMNKNPLFCLLFSFLSLPLPSAHLPRPFRAHSRPSLALSRSFSIILGGKFVWGVKYPPECNLPPRMSSKRKPPDGGKKPTKKKVCMVGAVLMYRLLAQRSKLVKSESIECNLHSSTIWCSSRCTGTPQCEPVKQRKA